MFPTMDRKEAQPKVLSEFMLFGADETLEYIKESNNSFFQHYSMEELQSIYGPEALDEERRYIKSLEDNNQQNIVPKVNVDEKTAVGKASTNTRNINGEDVIIK